MSVTPSPALAYTLIEVVPPHLARHALAAVQLPLRVYHDHLARRHVADPPEANRPEGAVLGGDAPLVAAAIGTPPQPQHQGPVRREPFGGCQSGRRLIRELHITSTIGLRARFAVELKTCPRHS